MPSLDIAINSRKALEGANQFQEASKKIKTSAGDIDTSVDSSGIKIRSLGDNINILARRFIGLYGVYRAYNFAKASVMDFAEFETGIAKLSTQLDKQSLKYLPEYKDAITSVSIQFHISAKEITSALTDIINGGIEAGKALDVLKIASKAAKAGFTDVSTVANTLTSIINSYKLSSDDAAKITDKLFAATVRGRLSFNDLTTSLGGVISIAASMGVSLDQIIAAMVTMSQAGVDSGKAVFSLRAILDAFLTPSEEAAKVAREFNIELKASTLVSGGLIEVLNKLKGASIEQTSAIFGSMRSLNGLSALLQQTSKFTEDLNAITNSAGATQEAYGKVIDTTSEKLKYLNENINSIKRTIGGGLVSLLYDITTGETLSKWLIKLMIELKEVELAAAKANLALYPPEEAKRHIAEHRRELDTLKKSIEEVFEIQEIYDEKINISGTDMLNYNKQILQGINVNNQFKESVLKINEELSKQDSSLKLIFALKEIEKEIGKVQERFEDLSKADWVKDVNKLKDLGKGLAGEELDKFNEALDRLRKIYYEIDRAQYQKEQNKQAREMLKNIEEENYLLQVQADIAESSSDALRQNAEIIAKYEQQLKKVPRETKYSEEIKKQVKLQKELNIQILNETETRRKLQEQEAARKSTTELLREVQLEKELLTKTDDERERAIKLAQLEREAKILGTEESKNLVEQYKNELIELKNAKEIRDLIDITVTGIGDLVNAPLKAILMGTENFGEELKNIIRNIGINIVQTMFQQMITQPITSMATKILTSAFLGVEKGGIFSNGRLQHFNQGGIINKPMVFPMSNGLGLMGESGPEAVVPLARDKSGRLGVRNEGSAATSIKIINVLDKTSFEDYLSSGDGERVVMNIIKRNNNVIRDIS